MLKVLLTAIFIISVPQALCAEDVPLQKEGDEQKFQGFNLQGYNQSGEKSWDVNGDTADIMGTEIKLSNVNANSYGDQNVNVTADTGMIDQVSGNMRLEQDVIITSEDGMQLMTDSLDWSREADLVTTEEDVMITDEGFTVTGTGLTSRPGLKNAQIEEDVTVTVETEQEQPERNTVTITSDGPMVVDQASNFATFEDNVVAIQLDRTLRSDRMEVYFNAEMNEIKELVCIGNVVIIQGDNETYAQRANYDAIGQKLTLSGRPKLILTTEGANAITASGN